MKLELVHLSDSGVPIVEDVCCDTHPHDCVNLSMGMGMLELSSLSHFIHSKVDRSRRVLLHR